MSFEKRALLFWVGCLGSRAAATWLAYAYPSARPYLGMIAAIIALGFTVIYFGHLRQTGPEVFGERIWWDSLRPVHALLYGAFAYSALQGRDDAWRYLALDGVIGALAWIHHHNILT